MSITIDRAHEHAGRKLAGWPLIGGYAMSYADVRHHYEERDDPEPPPPARVYWACGCLASDPGDTELEEILDVPCDSHAAEHAAWEARRRAEFEAALAAAIEAERGELPPW